MLLCRRIAARNSLQWQNVCIETHCMGSDDTEDHSILYQSFVPKRNQYQSPCPAHFFENLVLKL